MAATIRSIIESIQTGILNPIISLLFTLAVVIFLWGIVNYVIGIGGNEKKLETGKKVMLWGIIGMFLMASARGIVAILCQFFGTGCR